MADVGERVMETVEEARGRERPWLAYYDAGVPHSIDYPDVPLTELMARTAAAHPKRAATHFYGEVLGLPRNEHVDHKDWIEYEDSNLTLAVMTPETHDYEFAPLPPGDDRARRDRRRRREGAARGGRLGGRRDVGLRRLPRRRALGSRGQPHSPPPPVQAL